MTLVIDASVAAKWFVREELHEEALTLLAHGDLHAPDLIGPEVANVAWKKCVRGEIGREQAALMAAAAGSYFDHLHPCGRFAERALQMAFALDHPVYDCVYVACAEAVGGRLITADRRLREAAGSSEFAALIRHLGDPGPVERRR